MTEINNFTTQEPADKEIIEYLRKVSQCIYNLRKIIDAHFIEPVEEDKELNSFYLDEIYVLNKLLKKPVGMAIISPNNIKISQDLMFNRGKTKSAQKQIEDADDYIRMTLSKVQMIRHKYHGASISTQGLAEGSLKIFLTDFVDKKRKITEEPKKIKLEFANSNRTQYVVEKLEKSLAKDLMLGPLIYKIDNGIYFKDKPIKMRRQIKILCILFMENYGRYIEYVTIKDTLQDPRKRQSERFKTIEKYVSELHKILQGYFKKKVIFNDDLQGYILDIDKRS